MLDLLFPPHCVACHHAGAWLCPDCLAMVHLIRPPMCDHCGAPRAVAGCCRACRQSASHLNGVRSAALHLAPLDEAVHALKYEGVRVLADPLAALMAACWQAHAQPVDAIVPLPLHPTRERQRGYNQSLLLAKALARSLHMPVEERWVVRTRNTRAQVGLSRTARRDNVAGAFQAQGSAAAGRRVLLIDDVMTTGATLEACAEALRHGGAAQVWALTLARAVGRVPDAGPPIEGQVRLNGKVGP
ncbi:MAG: double zinc ribbon domain-containing protein [Anaerolineae bacterium]